MCVGGSLQSVISQDERLPEDSIKKFGADIVEGLHHIHSLGIVFSDIKPSKVHFALNLVYTACFLICMTAIYLFFYLLHIQPCTYSTFGVIP